MLAMKDILDLKDLAANREEPLEHHRLCASPLHHFLFFFVTPTPRVESDDTHVCEP